MISGLGVAMVTPFDAKGQIDWDATHKLVEYLVAGKTDFLVVLGTTGEAPTLSKEEQTEFVREVVKCVRKRIPIVVGKSSNNTALLCRELEVFDYEGVDYILTSTPSYNKPNARGLYRHFEAVAGVAKVPIILYNVPGRTGVNLPAEVTLKLANTFKNIVGIKEASGDLDQAFRIIVHKPEHFVVLSGNDSQTIPMMALGADGVISVLGNVVPQACSYAIHLAADKKYREAALAQDLLFELDKLLFEEGNPVGIKCAMSLKGLCRNNLRLPLVSASEDLQQRIECVLKQLV